MTRTSKSLTTLQTGGKERGKRRGRERRRGEKREREGRGGEERAHQFRPPPKTTMDRSFS
jgi:hypothetical protein